MAGAGAFLGRICLPAAEEFGLLLRDKVSHWRGNNAAKITLMAEQLLESQGGIAGRQAHPRIVGRTLESGSWEDDDQVQSMWAGLLASGCSKDGKDQSNLVFIHLLEQMTSAQAKILKFCCERAHKYKSAQGYVHSDVLQLTLDEVLLQLSSTNIHDADVQLDHMRELGVFLGGFQTYESFARIEPTSLGLSLYTRSTGFTGSPIDFFQITEVRPTPPSFDEAVATPDVTDQQASSSAL